MKKVLPNLISSQQITYVAQNCINESGRLTSDLLSVTKNMKVKGYLVTIEIEKAFDSLIHTFLHSNLEKFGFGKTFMDWVKIFLTKQELCVINIGMNTRYFKLEIGARQCDPVIFFILFLIHFLS